ncbi:potassium channel family protein [Streptococcus oriscaviae]|uniref:Potassium channel family protein n=1 Tax=Streptococcus oriscaviae TaxID=2781599 RepID=A0ABX7YM16_9STRE|nr:potassium channel family protein [Streptococcus oriscaviae]QUE54728.1 potassium channel family protein [Streptococcus oriscaviae]
MIKKIIQHPNYETLMTGLAIVYVILIIGELLTFTSQSNLIYQMCNTGLWLIFVFDYCANLYYAEDRKVYIKTHILDLIAILPFDQFLGFFRLGRIARLFRLLRIARLFALSSRFWDTIRSLLNTNGLSKILILNLAAVVSSSILLSILEDKPIFDALWWSIVTMTTVGYGDIVPQDWITKIIAIVLMLVGICTFGMVTSAITRFFIDGERESKLDIIMKKLVDQSRMIEELEAKIDNLTQEKK